LKRSQTLYFDVVVNMNTLHKDEHALYLIKLYSVLRNKLNGRYNILEMYVYWQQ